MEGSNIRKIVNPDKVPSFLRKTVIKHDLWLYLCILPI